jgi:hypothetical protein
MRNARGAAYFCVFTGIATLGIWTSQLATGRMADVMERPIAYAFLLTAEALTVASLLLAGIALLSLALHARRLFFFAGGMLFIAAIGLVVTNLQARDPVFIAAGALVAVLTLVFLSRNYSASSELVYMALGTVLYGELVVLGNLLQAGDMGTAIYAVITMAVTVPVTLVAFRRPL